MMWTHEQTGRTDVPVERVWEVLVDLPDWPSWDTSMEWVVPDGPIAPGTRVTMKPIGQDPIASTIVEATENRRYADETGFQGAVLRFSHTLTPVPSGGTDVVHRLEIEGLPDEVAAEVGAGITSDFPEAMDGLLARAAEAARA